MRFKGAGCSKGGQAEPDRIQPEILKATSVASFRPFLAQQAEPGMNTMKP